MPDQKRGLLRKPILHTFASFTGNQRVCLYTEPLFGIPSNLFIPLAAVYKAALGLTPLMIGLVTTVSLISQTIAASVASVVDDKLGRRRATALSELFAWIIPCILWASAQGPAAKLLAAMFNGCLRISQTVVGFLSGLDPSLPLLLSIALALLSIWTARSLSEDLLHKNIL